MNRAALFRRIVIAGAAAGLALLVLAAGSGSVLIAAGQPQLAAAFANRGAIVEARLRGDPPPEDPAALAVAGIGAIPASPVAWHALAVGAYRRGAVDAARAALAMADRWTRRDTPTQALAYRDAVARGDAVAAMRHADPLLRRGRMRPELFGDIGTRLHDPAMRAAFAATLATAPGWRADYFASAVTTTPVADLDAVLGRLRMLGAPLVRAEARVLLTGLIARGEGARAFAIWRRDLVPGGTDDALTWPDAAAREAPLPFDWHFSREAEAFVSIEGDRLRLDGAATGRSIDVASRTLVLAPGRYRLTAAAVAPVEGWRWSMACNGQGGQSRPIAEGDFIIPAQCGHAVLTLTLVNSSDSASIDAVRIAPLR